MDEATEEDMADIVATGADQAFAYSTRIRSIL